MNLALAAVSFALLCLILAVAAAMAIQSGLVQFTASLPL